MHELSIAAAVVERAERTARDHGAASVEAVRLRVGALSEAGAEALRFSIALTAQDTLPTGADLVVDEVPARAVCPHRRAAFDIGTPPHLWCGGCGRPAEHLLSGVSGNWPKYGCRTGTPARAGSRRRATRGPVMCRSADVREAVLAKDDGLAAALRAELAAAGGTAVNLLSHPGSGKAALPEPVLRRAGERGIPVAVLDGGGPHRPVLAAADHPHRDRHRDDGRHRHGRDGAGLTP